MLASQPVRPPPSRLDGHLGALGTFVAAALVLLVVKPWGSGVIEVVPVPSASPTVAPSQAPRPTPTPGPLIGFSGLAYDPSIWGNHEPAATWQLWPAGYLVTYGFIIQLVSAPSPDPSAAPPPGGPVPITSPSVGPPLPGPGGSGTTTADRGPAWPTRFDVPAGDHLFLIGINMPRGYSIGDLRLARYPTTTSSVAVHVERLPGPWPDHFAVLAIPTGADGGRIDVWPPGRYRLDLTFDPGGISRSLEILITG